MKLEKIRFSPLALKHMEYWYKNDQITYLKIRKLIESAMSDPTSGIGKPEKLSGDLKGYWSRRINLRDRLVYTVRGRDLYIIQARFHYEEH